MGVFVTKSSTNAISKRRMVADISDPSGIVLDEKTDGSFKSKIKIIHDYTRCACVMPTRKNAAHLDRDGMPQRRFGESDLIDRSVRLQ